MPKRKQDTAKIRTENPPPKSMHFPFSKLPAEIRNSIYQQCLSVHRHNLCFSLDDFPKLDVNTSLLCANKQVYAEAMPILYSGSMSATIGNLTSIPFRREQASRGDHWLRNGRKVSMTSSTGRIYPHVLARFRKIVLFVDVIHRRRESRGPGGFLPPITYTMVRSPRLENQIEGVLRALKPTLQSSFMGPRVREIEINIDSEERVLLLLKGWRDPERVAEFRRGQKRLLMPFAQLFGLQRVQIVGDIDQDYANQLKKIMEGHGPGSQEAKKALAMMIHAGNYD